DVPEMGDQAIAHIGLDSNRLRMGESGRTAGALVRRIGGPPAGGGRTPCPAGQEGTSLPTGHGRRPRTRVPPSAAEGAVNPSENPSETAPTRGSRATSIGQPDGTREMTDTYGRP